MRLLPLGVGDAFSTLYYSSCLALESGGEWLLVDCPHPVLKMLREAGEAAGTAVPPAAIHGVALTHLHGDHSSGLESLAYYFRFVLGKRLTIWAHPTVSARLWDGHLAAGMEQLVRPGSSEPARMSLEDYVELIPLDLARPVQAGPFAIETRTTRHHVPTTAMRIAAGGRRLGCSADTSFDEGLIAWLGEADLVVHETNLGIHTPYEKLAALPERLRQRMRLVHYQDGFDLAASVIEPLRQGRLIEV